MAEIIKILSYSNRLRSTSGCLKARIKTKNNKKIPTTGNNQFPRKLLFKNPPKGYQEKAIENSRFEQNVGVSIVYWET